MNIEKAMNYLLKCINIYNIYQFVKYSKDQSFFKASINTAFYPAFNNLGLLYITYFDDIEKATEFIKKAAYSEYPFGQNNLGIINQFYLNNDEYAKHMYENASQSNFALAEYNLGYLYAKMGDIDKSYEYYKKASMNESKPLTFHNLKYKEEWLTISKKFIICLTILSLFYLFFNIQNFVESKIYLKKAFIDLNSNNNDEPYPFVFKFHKINANNAFLYLKIFILSFPSFNIFDQFKNDSNLKTKLKTIFKLFYNQIRIRKRKTTFNADDEKKAQKEIRNTYFIEN